MVTCVIAFIAVVFSAYARLSDAGLGCANWPACYAENAMKQRQTPNPDATRRSHASWQWKLQNQAGLLLGILSVLICGISWQKRRELHQSPLFPTLLVGLMVFLGVFGVLAFTYLPRPIIVLIHLVGGIATLILLVWIALQRMEKPHVTKISGLSLLFSEIGLVLVLIEIMLGGWVSSNFAALACTEFPLCQGSLIPAMDFSYSLENDGLPFSKERLTAIHWMHRVGALITIIYLSWLSFRVMAVKPLRYIGKLIIALTVFQFVLGTFNVLLNLPLAIAVLHNAVAMLLLVLLVLLRFKTKIIKNDAG